MKTSTTLLCAVVSGVLLSLAYPPLGLGFMAYGALVPMLFVALSGGPWRVFKWSFLSGSVFLGISLFWVALHPDLVWPVLILVVIVLALFYTLPFVLSSLLSRLSGWAALLVFPFAVAGFEWIRSFDQFAFPWMIIGNSQTCYPRLIQFADITSAFGISWWIAAVNVTIFFLIIKRTVLRWVVLALLFVLPFSYSWYVMHRPLALEEEITVAMIQGNVTPEEKWVYGMEEWNINLYRSMTIGTAAYEPDIVIWPETAIPVYLSEISTYRAIVQSLVDSLGVPVLTGMPSIDFATGETWNSAGLFVPGGSKVTKYDKLHLVPFGEAIPLDNTFPALRKFELGQANWNEGTDPVIFEAPRIPPFNVLICFESIFPDLVRRFIERGSQLIVVITNDVWFGPHVSPIQHAMISVMRAVEFHRPVARCANTGISMFIDPFGRVTDMTGTFERTMLVGKVTPVSSETFYQRHGNVFSLACFMVSLASLFGYFIVIRRSPPSGVNRAV